MRSLLLAGGLNDGGHVHVAGIRMSYLDHVLLSVAANLVVDLLLKHAEFNYTALISGWMSLPLLVASTIVRKNSGLVGVIISIFVALILRTGTLILLEVWRYDA